MNALSVALLFLALVLLAVAAGVVRTIRRRARPSLEQRQPLEPPALPPAEAAPPSSRPERGEADSVDATPPPIDPGGALPLPPPAEDAPQALDALPTERPSAPPASRPPEGLAEREVVPVLVERIAVRPRLRPRRAPPPWYPIVLVHGVLGFDAFRVGLFRPEYFRGVAARLRDCGSDVHVVRVSPVAGIAIRAAQLAAQIRAIPAERVNVIAHSMGGLDARYAIAHLGVAERVASLTTVGTPHRGTPIADSGVWLLHERLRLRRLLEALGIDAFSQLTTEHLNAFNASVPDAADVYYASCPARVAAGVRGVNSLLAAGYLLLEREVGDNDGVVPTESQHWGEVLDEIDADHWAQVGWSNGFDAVTFYDDIVRALRRRRL